MGPPPALVLLLLVTGLLSSAAVVGSSTPPKFSVACAMECDPNDTGRACGFNSELNSYSYFNTSCHLRDAVCYGNYIFTAVDLELCADTKDYEYVEYSPMMWN